MTDPTERALRRGIIAHPHDDTARLVYADWLQEHAKSPRKCARCIKANRGPTFSVTARRLIAEQCAKCPECRGTGTVSDGRAERAEFIRVGCELARHDPERCPDCLRMHAKHKGEGRGVCHERVGLILKQNGLLTDDRRREWAGVPWAEAGDGDAFGPYARWNKGSGTNVQATPHYRRGFVSRVEVPGLEWVMERKRFVRRREPSPISFLREPEDAIIPPPPLEEYYEWRVTPWALAVAAAHPVMEFVMGDKEPAQLGGKWGWWENGAEERHQIGRLLWPAMYEPGGVRREWHDTRAQALDALAIAAADVVREAVLAAWAKEVQT